MQSDCAVLLNQGRKLKTSFAILPWITQRENCDLMLMSGIMTQSYEVMWDVGSAATEIRMDNCSADWKIDHHKNM